jgi:DNA-binding beta-propeller fold protein YncE
MKRIYKLLMFVKKIFMNLMRYIVIVFISGFINFNVLADATFVDSFSVNSEEDEPRGITFNNDGTKMFVIGWRGDDVNEYTLSTAWDVSTADFTDSVSISSQESKPTGLAFNNDGTKMFVIGWDGDDVNEYKLSTGFDVYSLTSSPSHPITNILVPSLLNANPVGFDS